ncbi:hypothetical protein J5690_05385 [bacterium]|nr:hypothetical protein [bacterium]
MTEREKQGNDKKGMSTGQKWAAGLGIAGAAGALGYGLYKLLKSEDEEIPEKISVSRANRLKNVGNIMKGRAYIHREEIENNLLEQTIENCRSVNLVGMRKIGKSSLVHNVLEAKTDEYYSKNIIVAKISANVFDSADVLFKNIAEVICNVIEGHAGFWGECDDAFQLNAQIRMENIEKNGDVTFCKFFETIKRSGKRVVCIIDEFYNTAELLKKYPGLFAVFKKLVTNSQYGVSFVFVSEIPIKELDFIGGNILYLRGFSDKELLDYYKRNEIQLGYEERAILKCIAGGHPYWSDIILAAYKEAKDRGKIVNVETIFREKAKIICPEFEKTLDALGEDLKNKLYQIVFGPMDENCTQVDIDTLYDYGIIDDKEKPQIISGKLYEYMKMKERDVNFFPLWHDTETGMRRILKFRLKREYTEEHWENMILRMYILRNPENIMEILQDYFFPNNISRKNAEKYSYQDKTYTKKQYLLSYDLKEAEKLKESMRKSQDIKREADISILESIYTKGLFSLYEVEYDRLKLFEIFGDYKEFIKRTDHLRKARNTYQHNNDILLTEDYKKKTIDCCKYLCECIKKTREWK